MFVAAVVTIILILTSSILVLMNKYMRSRNTAAQDIKAAVLNIEELEKHAEEVALSHTVSTRLKPSYRLVPRMEDNYKYIIKTYTELNRDVQEKKPVVPAAEWLFDNFYVIDEQIKEIRLNFPRGYYGALPSLTNGILRGFPRVYGMAVELVSHTDSKIDERTLVNFIKSYQTNSQLTSGELWAVPIILRIALIESIRYTCQDIMESREQRKMAEKFADMITSEEISGERLKKEFDAYTGVMDTLSPAFSEHLLEKLRSHGAELGTCIHFIDEKLSSQDTTAEDIIRVEHREEANQQVSMGNAITSLRLVSTLDWENIFELSSPVEKVLRQDPSGIYPRMDFHSRDYYRHEVEDMARTLRISESRVAKKAVECAEGAEDLKERKRHVGYFIVGRGRSQLETMIGYRPRGRKAVKRFMKRHPMFTFLLPIALIWAGITYFLVLYGYENNSSITLLIVNAVIILLPASELAVGIMNWMITHIMEPSFLPKLELKEGIPEDYTAMVVVPTLLPNTGRVNELLGQLEVYYLANQNKNLYFALLGDYTDAKSETMPDDEAIINTALHGIKGLNKKYAQGGADIFYFFHRYRKYNPGQGVWMGWERKRGKLEEFNELLRNSGDTSYYIKSSDISSLPQIKYVITLDADTELPRGAAQRLVGTLSHPLNKAVIDVKSGRVMEGYGVLQPRVSIGVINANKSRYSRIFAGQGGIDPYTTAVSDVYQDLFGEGIYTGKGIYDVDVFRERLAKALPDNRILSHDLLEGAYVRAGLVTDIELVDGFPWKYSSYMARLHRWVRGDWQLLPYLLPVVRNNKNEYMKNPLSAISKWKVIDNMRRSLVPPAVVLLIFLAFSVLPGSSLLWLGFALLTIAFPIITDLVDNAVAGVSPNKKRDYISTGLKNIVYQIILMFIFLPYKAYMMVDAVLRSITRLTITKKNLLEWETAADADRRLKNDRKSYFLRMWVSPVTACILFLTFLYNTRGSWPLLMLFVIPWFLAPLVAYYVSMPVGDMAHILQDKDVKILRKLSRKTWRYFDDFAGPEDNYLPPDNYQEDPPRGAAHRTSSTNIGLLLASILAARDMGYINTAGMIERLEHTFMSLDKLDKWKGHFYNWYDTVTLQPLRPLYISTVDSGNLVGYIMTLEQGLVEYKNKPLIGRNLAIGLLDIIELLNDDLSDAGCETIDPSFIEDMVKAEHMNPVSWVETLDRLKETVEGIDPKTCSLKSYWAGKTIEMAASFKEEMMDTCRWVEVLPSLTQGLEESIKPMKGSGERIHQIISRLNGDTVLSSLAENYRISMAELDDIISSLGDDEVPVWLKEFKSSLMKSYLSVNKYISRCKILVEKCQNIAVNTQFKPLFDEKRQLFSIGYSAEDERLNMSYYDLLASEARQTSFIAIAKGDIKQDHWFRLGRPLTVFDNRRGLVSWSGTMFEYLMPLLIMKNYRNTLLDETYRFILMCQVEYGKARHVPWGVSESGYYAFDILLNYQYRAFGVPKLGLKRGLVNDMVVAPYAAVLALQVDPSISFKNIMVLKDEGLEGDYGLYEAVDYTPSRLPMDKKSVIVKSYMVHHHGMSLLALNNFINSNIMQERFHRNPLIRSTELLLQEKVPNNVVLTKDIEEEIYPLERIEHIEEIKPRVIKSEVTDFPEANIVSNGNYYVVLTNRGTGYSRYQGFSVTRWREDEVIDTSGMFFYIRNVNSNMVWSAAYMPYKVIPEEYNVIFSSDKVEYHRVDGSIDTRTEIVVSPEDNAEVRSIFLTNHSDHSRVIEITSYYEVVISNQSADVAHPAFNNLFIRTEFVPGTDTLLGSRRPRSTDQKPVWLFHTVTVEGDVIGGVQYETDRLKFIGRNRDISNPAAMDIDRPLSGSAGAVLDPIMSLRKRVSIKPGETVKVSYITGIASSRDEALVLARKYYEGPAVNRAYELAWTRSQVEQRYLGLKEKEIELYQKLISHIIYISPLRRMQEDIIRKNTRGQSALWPYGISGDLPIILVTVSHNDEVDIVHEALKMHEYLRLKGLSVDLVILNEYEGSYIQPLQEILLGMIASSHACDIQNRPGGVFLRQSNVMQEEDRILLFTAARVVLRGDEGSIQKQVKFVDSEIKLPERKKYPPVSAAYPESRDVLPQLLYFNDIGGFNTDGSEYVIQLKKYQSTPARWSNIISTEKFGFMVTESGGGYTWSENSRENKLTPWSNDPVIDPPGEIVYLRDEDEGEVWSIAPSPIREKSSYTIRHGFGYTVFEHGSHGIKQEMTLFVPTTDNVKIYRIKLKNISGKVRTISPVFYIRPVLGVTDQTTSPYIVTEVDEDTGIVFIKNTYSDDFQGRIAYIDSSMEDRTFTGDRKEFIGSNGSIETPVALERESLSCRVGGGYDPCACIMGTVTINVDEEKEIIFMLGQEISRENAVSSALKYRNKIEAQKALDAVKEYWRRKLGTIQVSTPDVSLNLLSNGWLMYQTLACRVWARSAFYQSGGAYGFRDQLQDVMAVLYISPDITKKQILDSSAHQYVEGDVQHWWHPVTDKGIRTKFSDDLLWLPYVVSDYSEVTGDFNILDIETPFLEDEPLREDEDERYNKPRVSEVSGTIYDHCIRAIERSLKFGEHGIPLMGSGDWNDGMNTVGNKGRGESIWLGWFLYTVLMKMVPICRMKGDNDRADRYIETAKNIVESIEKNGWDGSWYRRAYFDDSTPLGSASNTECQIDSLAQSWSAISGAARPSRVNEAMGALEQYLIRRDEGIILLLTPPFDESRLEPGYIKSYVPGVRENGGQYTHAAVWVILAFTMMGKGNRSWELYNMINPINHSNSPMQYTRYKVEPYVMAADVYAVDPHKGRGGWTWYTGTAGWMYRVCIEHMLGLKLRSGGFEIDPCIPKGWDQYVINYWYMDTMYKINIKNPYGVNGGIKCIYLDGTLIKGNFVQLTDDKKTHNVDVEMG